MSKSKYEKRITRLIMVVVVGIIFVGGYIVYKGIQIETNASTNVIVRANDRLGTGIAVEVSIIELPDFTY